MSHNVYLWYIRFLRDGAKLGNHGYCIESLVVDWSIYTNTHNFIRKCRI